MQLTNDETDNNQVLEALEGDRCSFCDRGRLVRGRYKGNAAVICDACETPGAQLW